MAVDGIDVHLAESRRNERNPATKHQIQPGRRDERVDAGRDGQICFASPNSQPRTGTGFSLFSFRSVDQKQHWRLFPVQVDAQSAETDDHQQKVMNLLGFTGRELMGRIKWQYYSINSPMGDILTRAVLRLPMKMANGALVSGARKCSLHGSKAYPFDS